MPRSSGQGPQLIPQAARVQYQGGTGGSYIEKPAETQTSVRLASPLVRAHNSLSGGREFESSA